MSTKEIRKFNLDGGRYPFKVPDKYFDDLTARIMEQIPEEQPQKQVPSRVVPMRRNMWLTALSIAASLALIVTIALNVIPSPSGSTTPKETLTADYTNDDYNEDLMTYAMVDNMDVYYYLAAEDADE
jgi:hypothetical protein